MASPMPEEVTISVEEYSNLLMIRQSADYVYGIMCEIANTPDDVQLTDSRSMIYNLLDEWTK